MAILQAKVKHVKHYSQDLKTACNNTIEIQIVATNVSVNYNWVHPRALGQKTCPGGRDLTFESCLGAGSSKRAGILWKMKLKLNKNSVDQIFTGENKNNQKKKQVEFFTFLEVYMLFFFQ